jgi:hypothetical protein
MASSATRIETPPYATRAISERDKGSPVNSTPRILWSDPGKESGPVQFGGYPPRQQRGKKGQADENDLAFYG